MTLSDGRSGLRHAAIVYNPIKVDLRELRLLVEQAETDAAWGPSLWAATTVADAGGSATQRLLATDPDVVVAVGGDGTVSAVAEVLRHGDVPLAIVPSGTTNLFARALGLPLTSQRRAVAAAFSSEVRTVDIGRVTATLESGGTTERAFLVMTGMGVDAQMVVNTSARGKSALGWAGYIGAILFSLLKNRQFEASYSLDGRAEPVGSAHTLVVGNAGLLPAGMRMIPGALIDDGELDVLLLRPRGLRGWTSAITWFVNTNTPSLPRRPVARAAALGAEPVKAEFVQHARAASVDLVVDSAQDFEVDGEYIGRATSLQAWIEAGALRVQGSVADPLQAARRSGEHSSRSQRAAENLVGMWRRLVFPTKSA